MAFDFPDTPTVGQAYSGYVWDGEKWAAGSSGMPEPPNDSEVYGRVNSDAGAWARSVALDGDTMTGPLVVPNINGATAFDTPPTAPTPAGTDNSTKLATTAFVKANVPPPPTGFLPLAGGTVTGALAVNGELLAAAGYLRFTTTGGPAYIQWTSGTSYNLGGNTIWHSANLNPAVYVSNARLAFAGDYLYTSVTMAEPYGGSVITGASSQGGPYLRHRYMQLLTSSWFTIGYA